MVDREKVIRGLENCGQPMECDGCQYDTDVGNCFTNLKTDALELLKEQENCVSIPFTWLVKFCTHLDFHEPMSDEERAERWKEKLSQQLGVKWDNDDINVS